ncbi:MAG: hypothetical protein WA212_19280 [Candidatus Acidiferrales bacterium]
MAMILCDVHTASAIPAFARKYGLPCSACHTAWPELNNFGQVFRDNGYQLMNDRDSPIWQNPSYFPISFRITPNWHRESTDHQAVDLGPGLTGVIGTGRTTQAGFDLSGMDLWSAGTIYKNISFVLLPSSDPTAVWHFESAFVRFDNLKGTPWLNLKFGRFELDSIISEKRFLFLSNNGGIYQLFHFNVPGTTNDFGFGDNQIGMELAGHSANSYERYSIAMLSSNEGGVNLTNNNLPGGTAAGRSYDVDLAYTQAFNAPGFSESGLGLQRVQAFAYIGQRPTYYQYDANANPLVGLGNKSFYRIGVEGIFTYKNLELLPMFMHGHDSAYLGNATPSYETLPAGAQAPTFNGGFLELHYFFNPENVALFRFEKINVGTQPLPSATSGNPGDYGNVVAYDFAYRWYPIMFSRAGLALHAEYSLTKSIGIVPESGDGTGNPPLLPTDGVWSSSIFFGFDFDF